MTDRVVALQCPWCDSTLPILERSGSQARAKSYEVVQCWDCPCLLVVQRDDDGFATGLTGWSPEV
jgi:hypothetical protein